MGEPAASNKFQLNSLSEVEGVCRIFARSICSRYGIDPEKFDIKLVASLERGEMSIQSGNPVMIEMIWPPVCDGGAQSAMSVIKWQLDSAFRAMIRLNLYRPMEIVPIALIYEHKKFFKKRFGDLTEIIPDLVPRQRLRVQQTVTTTVTDVKTGQTVSVTETSKATRFDGENVGLWIELSRKVRELDPTPIDDPPEPSSDTPELDAAAKEITVYREPEVKHHE